MKSIGHENNYFVSSSVWRIDITRRSSHSAAIVIQTTAVEFFTVGCTSKKIVYLSYSLHLGIQLRFTSFPGPIDMCIVHTVFASWPYGVFIIGDRISDVICDSRFWSVGREVL